MASVLSAIGRDPGTAGTGGTWVTTDGRWSNGVLSGAWHKDQAGYIGEGAREAARRARIESLEHELDQERAAIEGIDAELADVEARQELLAAEHRTVPPDGGVREAHTGAAVERRALARAREDHATAVTVCQRRQEELATARARVAEFAEDVGLPADPDELAGVRAGVGAYRVALAGLWPAAEAAHAAIRAAAEAETELADSRQLLIEASERAAEAREAAGAAATTYQELLATVGTAVEELQRRLAEVTGALGRLRTSGARRPPAGTGGARGTRQGGRETGRTADAGRRCGAAAGRRGARVPGVRRHRAAAGRGDLAGDPGRGAAVGGDADGDPGPRRQRRTRLRGRRGRAVGPDPEAGDRGAQAAGGRDGQRTGTRRG